MSIFKASEQQANKTIEIPIGWRGWIFDSHLATVFLLRLPLPTLQSVPDGALARSMRVFPLIGAGIGTLGGITYAIAKAIGFTSFIAALLTLAAITRLTGALHEDGLADTADGFGSNGSLDYKLMVMRDSRVGTFGALALVFVISIRATAIATIGDVANVTLALVLAEAMGRTAIPLTAWWISPARYDGLGATIAANSGKAFSIMITAFIIVTLLALLIAQPASAVGVLLTMVTTTRIVATTAHHHIGGYTGDVLGAACYISSTAVLLSLTIGLR